MNRFKMIAAGVAFAVMGTGGFAATIDTTGYTSTNLDTLDGFASLDNEGGLFSAVDFGGDVFLGAFLPFSDTSAELNYFGFATILASIETSVMTEMVQFLFADGMTRYLLTVDATGSLDVITGDPVNFLDRDEFALFDVDATITLDQLDLVNVVPLPAGMVLLLTGMGALAFLRRRSS